MYEEAAKDEVKEAIKQDILDKKMKKVKKMLPSAFIDSVEAAQNTELKGKIAQCAIELEQLANSQEVDENILKLKAQLDDLNGGYRDTRQLLQAKIKWLVHLLEQRGVE